jgi:sterol desaturase/sphingolipid hydroxylase (fatty acid hydroxylase superfamily)
MGRFLGHDGAVHLAVIGVAVLGLGVAEILRTRGDVLVRARQDWIVELACLVIVPGIIVPAVTYAAAALLGVLIPDAAGALASWSVPAMVVAFLICDDLTQYLWHRLAHAHPLFWRLHRPHHAATKMGVLVMSRNNVFYYAMMPGLWLSPLLVHLGMGVVYPFYAATKTIVIASAHSELRWDMWLWRSAWTRPLAWVLERVISTPATHFAHHGLEASDPGTHYRGNYGNLLFLWDVLFGTARITRRYPASYGIENEVPQDWSTQLVWPLVPERTGAATEASEPATLQSRP